MNVSEGNKNIGLAKMAENAAVKIGITNVEYNIAPLSTVNPNDVLIPVFLQLSFWFKVTKG